MTRKTYMVLSEDGGEGRRGNHNWRIEEKGTNKVVGHYDSQDVAIAEARKIAKQEHRQGEETQVLVQASTGEWRTEWTYGGDPHPPKG